MDKKTENTSCPKKNTENSTPRIDDDVWEDIDIDMDADDHEKQPQNTTKKRKGTLVPFVPVYQFRSIYVSASTSKTCSAMNCSNSKWSQPQLTFFKFPRDEDRCKIWKQNARRKDIMNKPVTYCNKNLRLCALHFEDTQFMNAHDKKSLIWNAVPRLFSVPNAPKVSQKRRKITKEPPATPRKAKKHCTAPVTPSKERLKKSAITVRALRATLRNKDREIKRLKKQLENTRKMENVIEAMKPYLSKDEHELVAMQMRLSIKKKKVYSDFFRAFCIGVYFKSPVCYRFLQTRFKLPSKSTINR